MASSRVSVEQADPAEMWSHAYAHNRDLAALQHLFSQKPLRVVVHCADIVGPGFALVWLGIPYDEVGAWEIDETLGPVLRARCPQERRFLGSEAGNFLSARPCHFPCADILVVGPPCPPWSVQGIAMSFFRSASRGVQAGAEMCSPYDQA